MLIAGSSALVEELGMLQEPHIRALAERLRTCLDAAQSGTHVAEGTRVWS